MEIKMATLSCFLACASVAAGEPALAARPTVTRAVDHAEIRFELLSPADVEVSICDAHDVVIRHLAAGVLGGSQAPPAPLAAGLSQRLAWDLRDDLGKPATGGQYTVRLRVGMKAVFGAALGEAGALGSRIYGMATDEKGELFVASGGGYGDGIFTIKVFSRDGEYLRTILPYRPDLSLVDVAGFGKQALRAGRLNPPQFHPLLPWIYPDALSGLVGNRVRERTLWLTSGRGEICRIRATDGACISWGSAERPAPPAQGPICWALAPGGKLLYLAGWYDSRKGIADGQIFTVDPAAGRRMPFAAIDVAADNFWAGEKNGWYDFTNWGRKNGLSAVHGLAVDDAGRVYACDRVKQRIAVWDASGSFLGSTKVEWPDLVAVGPRGEVYVTTRKIVDGYKAINEIRVLKLSNWNDGTVLAELTLRGRNAPSLAVDTSGDPPVIWLSNVTEVGGSGENDRDGTSASVLRIEDRGDALIVTGKLGGGAEPLMPEAVVKVWADPCTGDIVVSDGWNNLSRRDGVTGERKEFPLRGMDLCFAPDGNLYVYGQQGWHELVARFDRGFKPVPFPATGKNTTTMTTTGKDVYGRYGHGWSNKGIFVAPNGRVYAHNMYDWTKYFVNVWDRNGAAEKHLRPGDGIIGPTDPEGGGLHVDAAGNVYLGLHGAPADAAAVVRPGMGSVVKFGPGGGGYVKRAGPVPDRAGGIAWKGSRVGDFVEGALAAYPMLSPQPSGGCVCKEARFDVDGWGRLFIPNGLDYCVRVVDNAGNEILSFGFYGNPDSRGPGSAIPEPAIPLGWPLCVSAGHVEKGRLYVADALNRRVIRVDLAFAIDESLALE